MLGITKEIDSDKEQKKSKSENQKLLAQLTTLRDSIAATINNAIPLIINSNCEGLETVFKLAANIPLEYDNWVAHLDGQESTLISGMQTNPMELY